jgi:hypothetical protein
MPKQTVLSQMDPHQIPNQVFDETNDAVRVRIIAETEMAIAISKDDGDSVHAFSKKMFVECSPITPATVGGSIIGSANVEDYSKVIVYKEEGCTVAVEVSPDGTIFQAIDAVGSIVEIIAKEIRVKASSVPIEGSKKVIIGLSS